MTPAQLWNMPPLEFNEWRKKNDYPRFFEYFRKNLPHFNKWLQVESLNSEILFDKGFAKLMDTATPIELCEHEPTDALTDDEVTPGEIDDQNEIAEPSSRLIEPYFYWLRRNYGEEIYFSTKQNFTVSRWHGRTPFFAGEIPLIQLGYIRIKNAIISGRHLDFCCLDRLEMVNCHSGDNYVWYSSAIGISFFGNSAFWSFHHTKLWLPGSLEHKNEMSLIDGNFQDFHFSDSNPHLHMVRSKLLMSSISGTDFECLLEHSSFHDVSFDEGENKYTNYSKEAEFFRKAKSLYSSIGNSVEAGNYFYREQKKMLLAQLQPSITYYSELFNATPIGKANIFTKSFLKLIMYIISYLTWGFGERPARSLFASLLVVSFSSIVYFIFPESQTAGDIWKSLYFSIVTFVTLGYGDITQKNAFLQFFSALEAFGGMFLVGLFLAGYASKSKQY